jgi:hypothetical protein
MFHGKTLRPDAKGRINLGALAKGISGFNVSVDNEQRIILEPLVEIPAKEQWLFNNPEALNQVKKGLQDAGNGQLTKKDFSQYLDDENE